MTLDKRRVHAVDTNDDDFLVMAPAARRQQISPSNRGVFTPWQ
jgi:hypothetical protein